MIPNTFDEWKKCIVNDCKIELTKTFAQSRINKSRWSFANRGL